MASDTENLLDQLQKCEEKLKEFKVHLTTKEKRIMVLEELLIKVQVLLAEVGLTERFTHCLMEADEIAIFGEIKEQHKSGRRKILEGAIHSHEVVWRATSSVSSDVSLVATETAVVSAGGKATSSENKKDVDLLENNLSSTGENTPSETALDTVAVFFSDDLENFNVIQEETVPMEREEKSIEEETFIPPSNNGPVSKDSGKAWPDSPPRSCHQESYQSRDRLENLCGECGKTFTAKRNLLQHIKVIHQSDQTFSCNVCDKVFRHLHNLNIHKQNQNHYSAKEQHLAKPKKYFECPVCHKAFKSKYNLRCHSHIHSGEKPFKCSYCSCKFVQSSNCKKHELTHTGQRPHSCDLCLKSFKTGYNLQRHRMIHDQPKNYLCPICGECFPQKWKLTKHEKKHATEISFNAKNEFDKNTRSGSRTFNEQM